MASGELPLQSIYVYSQTCYIYMYSQLYYTSAPLAKLPNNSIFFGCCG